MPTTVKTRYKVMLGNKRMFLDNFSSIAEAKKNFSSTLDHIHHRHGGKQASRHEYGHFMPKKYVRAVTVREPDGNYVILYRDGSTDTSIRESLCHELRHIRKKDV